jgi:hypothetical protein
LSNRGHSGAFGLARFWNSGHPENHGRRDQASRQSLRKFNGVAPNGVRSPVMYQLARAPRIDIAGQADSYPALRRDEGGFGMFRISFLFLSALIAAQIFAVSHVSAQQGHDACARDVSRFCRALMAGDQMAVLACLKQNRGRISKGCNQVLIENGQ